jgi:hypothetical protein
MWAAQLRELVARTPGLVLVVMVEQAATASLIAVAAVALLATKLAAAVAAG